MNFSLEHVADGRLRHAPLDLVPDRLHQVRLAHADAAVQEERVVSLRRTLRYGLASRMGKLVSASDDERVKGVARIELRGSIPVEARLRWIRRRGGHGTEAAVMPHRGCRRIILWSHEFHVIEPEAQNVDRFLDQVGVLVARVPELDGRNAHEQHASARVAVARRLQPRVVRVPVDFLFQRIENARPRIRGECCAGN